MYIAFCIHLYSKSEGRIHTQPDFYFSYYNKLTVRLLDTGPDKPPSQTGFFCPPDGVGSLA